MSLIDKMINYISGKYIKTISNQTIFGEGDIAGEGSGANWGEIGGVIENQTDLQNELNRKLDILTDEGEFIYTHEGAIQNSKAINQGDLLDSAAHIPSSRCVKLALNKIDEKDTNGFINITSAISYMCKNKMVTIRFLGNISLTGSTSQKNLCTMPEGYRPVGEIQGILRIDYGSGNLYMPFMGSNGRLDVFADVDTLYNARGFVMYLLN